MVEVKEGTGLATCRECFKKILKGQKDVVFHDKFTKHYHFTCIEKLANKINLYR